MNAELRAYLDRLLHEGVAFDASRTNRLERRRNLEPETAELLAMLVRATNAQRVLELGTSNGYSTIWLADAVRDTGGTLTSLDVNAQDEARANLHGAGISDVKLVQQDAGDYVQLLPDASVDVMFMDAERTEYPNWWPHPVRIIRPGGLIVVDNVVKPDPAELVEFFALVDADETLVSTTIEIGKGLRVIWKRGAVAHFQ